MVSFPILRKKKYWSMEIQKTQTTLKEKGNLRFLKFAFNCSFIMDKPVLKIEIRVTKDARIVTYVRPVT